MMPCWTHSDTMEPDSPHDLGTVSKTDILRGIIAEKLSTAAREILAVVERTVAGYEEEASGFRQEIDRQRRHLELLQPRIKLEPADDQQLFSLCEAGRRGGAEEEPQYKYELRVEDSRSLVICNAEEPMEEEEQQITEQENETTSRLLPPVIQSDGKTVGRSQISNQETYIVLRIRILEDSEIKVLSRKIFKKYCLQKLKCPCGLQEADFVDLLRSTFPQLVSNEHYDLLMTDKTKKLQPLKVDSFTPEQVFTAAGNSSIYFRLKHPGKLQARQKEPLQNSAEEEEEQQQEEEEEEEKEEEESHVHNAGEAPSTSHANTPDPINDSLRKRRPRERNSTSPINLTIHILEDSSIDVIKPRVFGKYRFHYLQCPRGLQEADFFKLLRSKYPQLAGDQPFTVLTSKGRKIQPLEVGSVTPEEIIRIVRKSRSTGHPVIYIRLEPRVKLEAPETSDAAAEDPLSISDPLTLNTSSQSDERTSGSPPNSVSHNHVDLRIRILEDSSLKLLSPKVFQKYPLLELQCPGGLTEDGFLDLLRSTFPQLADQGFDFLTGHGRKIRPIKSGSLTPEEINKTIKSAGNTVLYIQMKGQEEDQDSTKKHHLPLSQQTEVSMSSTSGLDEALRSIILRALPAKREDTVQALVKKLFILGLESIEDLSYIRPGDVSDLLPTEELQRLFEEFKNELVKVTSEPKVIPNPATAATRASGLTSSSPPGLSLLPNPEPDHKTSFLTTQTWPETFQVPWNLFQPEVCQAVAVGKRPSPAARRHMVRVLADEIRKHDPNPKRSHCTTICRKIIQQYPKSFADLQYRDELLRDGCASLVNQLKYRIENLHRGSHSRATANGLKRRRTDAYGCTHFQPALLEDETEETVELKRRRLEEIYGQDGADGEEVQQLMQATFYLQRRHINALPAPSVADLKQQWPYLFTQKGLFAHFEALTGVCIHGALQTSMERCGRSIVEFLLKKPSNAEVQAVLSQSSNLDLSFCVIQLLMAHFSEKLDGLILFASASSTAADVERTLALPSTPRLILLEKTPESCAHRWMVSFEGHVICEGIQPAFLDGLAVVFSTYYTFNLPYEDDAVCTLEFIQRHFVGINPGTGTKAGRKKRSKLTGKVIRRKMAGINPRVLSLLQKLMDFE